MSEIFCLKLLACAIWRASFCSLHHRTKFCHFSFGDKFIFHWIWLGRDMWKAPYRRWLQEHGSWKLLSFTVKSSCKLCEFKVTYMMKQTTQWHSWLSYCATSQKVMSFIPDGVDGIFHWHNPSGCAVALGSTQHLTAMSNSNIPWGVKADSV
jgi:hypothetical protein